MTLVILHVCGNKRSLKRAIANFCHARTRNQADTGLASHAVPIFLLDYLASHSPFALERLARFITQGHTFSWLGSAYGLTHSSLEQVAQRVSRLSFGIIWPVVGQMFSVTGQYDLSLLLSSHLYGSNQGRAGHFPTLLEEN